MTRQLKREVKIGNIKIGGTNPIAVQTMLNVPVKDIAGNVAQAKRVAAAGCQIVRVTVPSPSDAAVVAASKEAGFDNLKGHKSVGGLRASIYNAMPKEGVEALVEFLKKYEAEHA